MKKRTLPYGYMIRNGEITIDRNAEKIIKEILPVCAKNATISSI